MHIYATDSHERTQLVIALGFVSALLAFGLHWTLDALRFSPPWFVEAPSVLGIYGALYKLLDIWLWKKPFMCKLGLVRVPNLAGRWEGHATSSYDGHGTQYPIRLCIEQSWTRLLVTLDSATSRSDSVTAAILIDKPNCVVLTYQYQNKPVASAVHTMNPHDGTAWLILDPAASDGLQGDYYTGRGRTTFGRLVLKRTRTSTSL
jgi:hypothetical protein